MTVKWEQQHGTVARHELPDARVRLFTTWLTSVDGVDHAVTDEDMAAGVNALDGRFPAVCAEIVTAASLLVPPGNRCPRCRAVVAPSDRVGERSIPRPRPFSQIVLGPVWNRIRSLFDTVSDPAAG